MSQQSWPPANLSHNAKDNKALHRHICLFRESSRTMTSQGRSENSDQSGPLHPMLPNTDLKQPWTAIPRRSTGSQDCVVDCNLHNSRAVHLTSRRSFSPVWRCLENVSLFLNVNFEIRVFSKPNLDYILNYRY